MIPSKVFTLMLPDSFWSIMVVRFEGWSRFSVWGKEICSRLSAFRRVNRYKDVNVPSSFNTS